MLAFWKFDPQTLREEPIGSGFLLGPTGHVLTALHVVSMVNPYQEIRVTVGAKEGARIGLGQKRERSEALDMCFLRMEEADVRAAGLSDADFYRVVPAARQAGGDSSPTAFRRATTACPPRRA